MTEGKGKEGRGKNRRAELKSKGLCLGKEVEDVAKIRGKERERQDGVVRVRIVQQRKQTGMEGMLERNKTSQKATLTTKRKRDKRREKVITNETCLKGDGTIAKNKNPAKNLKLINEYF